MHRAMHSLTQSNYFDESLTVHPQAAHETHSYYNTLVSTINSRFTNRRNQNTCRGVNKRVCKQRNRRISPITLTRTLMKRPSNSSRSGMGGFVRFLVDGWRTWWLLADATGPSNIAVSLDVIKPILRKLQRHYCNHILDQVILSQITSLN